MSIRFLILFIISFFLILIPFLLWGNYYLVGGDDTKLYYVFPKEFLQNYVFHIISDNTMAGAMTGYAPVSYFAPIFIAILILKYTPFVNTQMFMYGLNFAFGFIFFYLFLSLYIKPKNKIAFLSNVLGSFFYVFSIYLFKTIYINQLLSVYLLSVMPAVFYFFIKGVRENAIHFTLISVLIFSVFSSTLNTLPWSAAMFVLFPIFGWEFSKNLKTFVKHGFVWAAVFILQNIYWIFHLIYSYIHNTGLQSTLQYYSSSNFISDNIRVIIGVSRLYSPLNIPFNQLQSDFFNNTTYWFYINILFFALIVFAGLYSKKNKTYIISLLSFLLAWFFFSPNFGDWGPKLFLYYSSHIPFFTMFRNMYDKFALPLSFSYAFVFTISLHTVLERIKKIYYSYIILSIFFIVLGANIFLSSQYLKERTGTFTKFSGVFNNDFNNLVSYLKNNSQSSHVLWIPMNASTYVTIEDKIYKGKYYAGLSPLRMLANKSDYAGRFSFITQNDLFFGERIFKVLNDQKYDALGKIYQQMNAKYIIVDNQELPKDLQDWYYNFLGSNLKELQKEVYKNVILGKKLADFGNRYSLYEINKKYFSDKIYLTDNYSIFTQHYNLSYEKNFSSEYKILISHLKGKKKLVFLDPYYKDWVLYLGSHKDKIPYKEGQNVLVHGYANGWELDEDEIKNDFNHTAFIENPDGSINLTLNLYFKPQRFSIAVNIVSILAFGLTILYLLYHSSLSIYRKLY